MLVGLVAIAPPAGIRLPNPRDERLARVCAMVEADLGQNIPLSTLAYYLRRQTLKTRPRLARVKLTAPAEPRASFALVLGNGRRIESGWNFRDADLARLIRVAEVQ